MTAPIKVSFEALNQLSARADAISSSFAAMPAHGDVQADALGDPGLASELERFLSGWSQGRVTIAKELDAVTKIVKFAVTEYSRAETEITEAAGGSNGGSQ